MPGKGLFLGIARTTRTLPLRQMTFRETARASVVAGRSFFRAFPFPASPLVCQQVLPAAGLTEQVPESLFYFPHLHDSDLAAGRIEAFQVVVRNQNAFET